MLNENSAYVRIRGMELNVSNAKWDDVNKINSIIDNILELPQTSNRLLQEIIQLLPTIAESKPELINTL